MAWLYLGFFVLIIMLLAIDLGVFHRKSHALRIREAAWWSAFWIALGLLFSLPVYVIFEHGWLGASLKHLGPKELSAGWPAVTQYLTGYILEKSLSVDNIFVMAVIFGHFKVPAQYQHRILYWGILGAIIFRVIMIVGGTWLVNRFDWIFYVFGGYLVYAGIKMLLPRKEELDPDNTWFYRLARRTLRITPGDHGAKFLVRVNGKRAFTSAFLVLLVIETADVVFAVDSIPAVLAISTEPFVVITSNIFAILGLRSLYFVLSAMLNRFHYLAYSLAAILILIGFKMIAKEWLHISTIWSLGLILLLLAVGMILSLRKSKT